MKNGVKEGQTKTFFLLKSRLKIEANSQVPAEKAAQRASLATPDFP